MSTRQRAVLIHSYGGPDAAGIAEIAAPEAGPGEVVVRVRAAGLNAIDWKIREGFVRDAFPLPLPAVLGVELAGVVEAVGPGVTRFRPGDRVMGSLGRPGAYAERVAVDAALLAPTPDGLDDVQAAAIPLAGVAAWQSLHHAGPIRAGQRVLVHGASGGLGSFAVQFAHREGAEVIATASAAQLDYVKRLGADRVIDHRSARFETLVRDVDLVLDYVGGEVLDRSWQVLAPGGAIVGTTSPDILARTPAGRRGLWFVNQPDAARLQAIAGEVAAGTLASRIGEVVAFDDIPAAIERLRTAPQAGKVVAEVGR